MSAPDGGNGSPEPEAEGLSTRRRKRTLRWWPLLVEALFVMLGVALALAADQWREGLNQRRRAATALASIREELEANRRSVEQSLDYHAETFEALRTLGRRARGESSGAPAPLPDARTFSRGFVNPSQLLFTAWDAAHATDVIGHMEYADVLALASIYEQQRSYKGQGERIGELIYGRLFDEGFEGMRRTTRTSTRSSARSSSASASSWSATPRLPRRSTTGRSPTRSPAFPSSAASVSLRAPGDADAPSRPPRPRHRHRLRQAQADQLMVPLGLPYTRDAQAGVHP